jgi:pSer/pThr/pTyr-binding forkhead associated (FHA) protein
VCGARQRFAAVSAVAIAMLGASLARPAWGDRCPDGRGCAGQSKPAPGSARTAILRLVIEDNEHKQTVVPVRKDSEISIGRETGNVIRLTRRDVSPRHAILGCRAEVCWIEDLHSDNGVRVGGKRIAQRRTLHEDEIVEIGEYKLFLTHRVRTVLPPAPASRLVAGKRAFVLDRSPITIGRARDNDIVLDHPSVSPHHAVVERSGDSYRLLDQQSATGIRVNGEDYYGVDLLAGDEVEIGTVKLRFVPGGPAR